MAIWFSAIAVLAYLIRVLFDRLEKRKRK